MLPYARIAFLLDDISKAERGDKAGLAASLMADLPKDLLCPFVRLLTGELWPSWEKREMGMGPEAIEKALDEISTEDVQNLRKNLGDMGYVAEAALRQKSQHPVSSDPLEATLVYQSLCRISRQHGLDSEHRRGAILRGLFLDAEPIEAKYIARTVMRNMQVGLGPQTVIAAMEKAFDVEAERIMKAYALMPELGFVAMAASMGTLADVKIKPSRPVRPMLIRKGKISDIPAPWAYIPRYPGLRVQVHKAGGEFFVYTMRLRDVTSAMRSLDRELQAIKHDFIAEAELVGFQNGLMLGQQEMVSYINHESLSRRSTVVPALAAWDLLFWDEEDLTPLAYDERRRRLKTLLGEPKGTPFTGISTAEQIILEKPKDVEKYYESSRQKGHKGLIARDLLAPYKPGRFSDVDFYIEATRDYVVPRNG
jgi:DNA ligase-1